MFVSLLLCGQYRGANVRKVICAKPIHQSPTNKNDSRGANEASVNSEPFRLHYKAKQMICNNDTSNISIGKTFGTHPVLVFICSNFRQVRIIKNKTSTITHCGKHTAYNAQV